MLRVLLILPVCSALPVPAAAQDVDRGREVYAKWCAGCHGDEGDGEGSAAAYMLPRPRDFTRGVYQIRTTANGELPTDDDLRRVIDEGMPGTAMPGWKSQIGPGDRDAVIAYLKSFSRFFEGATPQALEFGRGPRASSERIAEGAEVYRTLECFKCHGDAGKGDGQSAPTLSDDWDFPIRAANLTKGWAFNGGASAEQIYRRLRTGLDGTPMPSFVDVVEGGIISDDQLWSLAHYVQSLSPKLPPVREVIRATLVEGAVPATPDDSAWRATQAFYVPLVGQIIVSPRWFTPRVDGIWVRAIHNGEQLALHIAWDDPSQSPDPAWQEWLERVAATVQQADGDVPAVQGPDRLMVQVPTTPAEGLERPYFLGGDARRPVHVWRWSSNPDQLEEGTGTGPGAFQPAAAASGASHAARFEQGQWRLVITRPLHPLDSMAAPVFEPGRAIPIAFRAADGSDGEDWLRSSVSAWYAIYLDVPTPPSTYVTPLIAAALTAGLGVVVVRRAQRRHGGRQQT
jgi:mono/diheme cytochrome c family protein